MIFVKNMNSVSDQDWTTSEKYPGVRWKFLIDEDYNGSKGISCGFAVIETGGDFKLHHHTINVIYI